MPIPQTAHYMNCPLHELPITGVLLYVNFCICFLAEKVTYKHLKRQKLYLIVSVRREGKFAKISQLQPAEEENKMINSLSWLPAVEIKLE